MGDKIEDGQVWKIRIEGPGFKFSDAVTLTSGGEVPLPSAIATRLGEAMRRYAHASYSITLLSQAKARK